MQTRTITSLAILKSNWDSDHRDYIDSFVPLFVHLIKKKQYTNIIAEEVRDEFTKEFQVDIPLYPVLTILNRLKKLGFIFQKDGEYYIVQEKIGSVDFEHKIQEEERKLNNLIQEFVSFSKHHYSIEISNTESEQIILSFFRDTDLSILFGSELSSTIPPSQGKASKSKKYIFANFLIEVQRANPVVFNFLVDISIGHALASALLYNEKLGNYTSKFSGLHFYLDASIIFDLIGMGGEVNYSAQLELINDIKNFGGKVFVFDHTFEEVVHIIRNAINWIEHPSFDYSKASRALRYFLSKGETSVSDLELFLSKIPQKLLELGIQRVTKPDYSQEEYQIDEKEVQEAIITQYKSRDPYFELSGRETTIRKDIDSISSIYRLRKGASPRTLKDARHVFLTNNFGLAKVATDLERMWGLTSVPACLTNVFIGTLIWLQSPARIRVINEGRLCTQIYAILQPDRKLINKYLEEINKLKTQKSLNEDDYYLLRSNRMIFDLLSEKALGDSELLTGTAISEIIDDVRSRVIAPTAKMYEVERESHATTKSELYKSKEEISFIEKKFTAFVFFIAKAASSIIVGICIGIILFSTFASALQLSIQVQIIFGVAAVLFGLFGLDA